MHYTPSDTFESFFRKFEVIAFLFTKLSTVREKIFHFLRKGCRLPTCLPEGESFILPILLLIACRGARCEYKLFSSLTRPVFKPKSTVSAADTLSTRLMIKNDKSKINSVVIYRMLCCAFD